MLSNIELNFLKNEEFVLHENWDTTVFRCALLIGGGIFIKIPSGIQIQVFVSIHRPFHVSALCAIDSPHRKTPGGVIFYKDTIESAKAGYFPNNSIDTYAQAIHFFKIFE